MNKDILVIQESLEDYVSNWANKIEIEKINLEWDNIKKAFKSKTIIRTQNIVFFALMSYCEHSISDELDRIALIDEAWLNIKRVISG